MNAPRVSGSVQLRRREKQSAEKPSSHKAKWRAVAAILLLAAVAAWAFWPRGNPQLAKIEQLRAQLEEASGEQRRELWGQLREEFSKLPPETREALFAERRQEWEARERKHLREFFALTREQQIAQLDKDIDNMERRRKAWEQRRSQGDRPPGGPSGNGFGGRGGGGGNSGDSLQRSKNYLDRTSPEDRAQRGEYRRMMQQRRQQRGLG